MTDIKIFALLALLMLILNPAYAANISLELTSPAKGEGMSYNTRWIEVNSTLEGDIKEIVLHLNGNEYSIYDDSLMLSMNFDGNASLVENPKIARDSSRYGLNGTVYGVSLTNDGRYGGAVEFDGLDDKIDLLGIFNPLPTINDSYSVSAWIKVNSYPATNGGIVGHYQRHGLYMSADGRVKFALRSAISTQAITSDSPAIIGVWENYAGVYDGSSKTIQLYKNGVLQSDVKNITLTDLKAISTAGIGGSYIVGGTGGYFNGSIDNVRIYNRTLSPEEIRLLYQSNLRKINETHWEFYANLTNLVDGQYVYYIWARDGSGNISQSELRHFSVEATNPQVRINSVSLESAYGGPVLLIKMESTDENLNYTKITVSNSTGLALNSTKSFANGAYEIGLAVPYEGEYIVAAEAYDKAGNTNQSVMIYHVDAFGSGQYLLNVVSKKPSLNIGGQILTVGMAFMAIIILLIALWKHNRKKKKPKKSPVMMLDYKGNS